MYCICGLAEVLSREITKDWIRKSQTRKVPHLRKDRNPTIIQVHKFADLQFAQLISDRPPLIFMGYILQTRTLDLL